MNIDEIELKYTGITLIEFYTARKELKSIYSRVWQREIRKRWQRLINTFNMANYKKEKIWEYLNNDITEEEFTKFVNSTFEAVYKRTK